MTKTQIAPISLHERIEVLDVLRGLAVCGILIGNMQWFSGYGMMLAISLGLINGDLFKRVAAFSPGFVIDSTTQGKPDFFISHGTRDHILPIDRCGRRIASDLKTRGYKVTFREFDGDHEIPSEVMREGLRWVAK